MVRALITPDAADALKELDAIEERFNMTWERHLEAFETEENYAESVFCRRRSWRLGQLYKERAEWQVYAVDMLLFGDNETAASFEF
jgi:hypothetical protein